jgi:hypothetical protein
MVIELESLERAARDFEREADDDFVDPKRLSAVVDRLQGKLSRVLAAAKKRHEHLLTAQSACSWAAGQCKMSKTAAADRLCVGEQLASMPQVADALSSGEIGFQAASVICHLQERVDQIDARIDEEMWIDNAKRFAIKDLREIAVRTWHAVDPEGFNAKAEDDFERRSLDISETAGGMYRLDGWLDPVGGAALRAAIDSLAKPLGADDQRTSKQRRADAIVELTHHALNEARLPRSNGVRPHISIQTTLEGLKGELGAPASQLEAGMPISSKTVQRLACDSTLHRVLKADSVVIDVGRATRAVSPSQWRALKARHRTCSFPGCDRPINWTSPHHIHFWARGGRNDLPNLLPLCHHHHRLVHEGDWQVVRAGEGVKFIPPERVFTSRRRWGERWAA